LCVRVCKEIVGREALRMERHGGRMLVVPVSGRCIGCGTCANLCPTHVIHVEDRGQLRTIKIRNTVIGQHPLERCEGCGKYYATEKHVHMAEERTGPHPQVKQHHHYCPACAKLFSDRLQFVQKHPPRQRFEKVTAIMQSLYRKSSKVYIRAPIVSMRCHVEENKNGKEFSLQCLRNVHRSLPH
jgi:bidirectional [NiFe] hydrogenase diaphorase subunit